MSSARIRVFSAGSLIRKAGGAHARLREMARPEKSQMTSGNRSANLEKCQEQMQTQTRMEMWIGQNISGFSSLAIQG